MASVTTIETLKLPGIAALMATAHLAQSPSEAAKVVGDQAAGSYPAMLLLKDTNKAYDG